MIPISAFDPTPEEPEESPEDVDSPAATFIAFLPWDDDDDFYDDEFWDEDEDDYFEDDEDLDYFYDDDLDYFYDDDLDDPEY